MLERLLRGEFTGGVGPPEWEKERRRVLAPEQDEDNEDGAVK
jgi:hypothetical protein